MPKTVRPSAAAAVPVPPTTTEAEDRYLSLAQLVEYSGLSLRSLSRHLNKPDNPLPAYRVGQRVLVRQRAFDHWVESANLTPTDVLARRASGRPANRNQKGAQ